MLFKRESDYGIRIVRALKEGNKLSVKEICDLEEIPEAFAYKILKKMQTNGIVSSERGPKGGYNLSADLDKVTLYDILISVEPDFSVIPCMQESCRRNTRTNPCKVHRELSSIQKQIIKSLSAKSMKEILED